jgi:hypothetical protein
MNILCIQGESSVTKLSGHRRKMNIYWDLQNNGDGQRAMQKGFYYQKTFEKQKLTISYTKTETSHQLLCE